MKTTITIFFLFTSSIIVLSQSYIDTSSFYESFNKLEINNNSIVMLGEFHNDVNSLNTELLAIKELAPKGFNTIYIEGGTSEAAILNHYYKTDNNEILKSTRASNPNFFEFFHKLKEVNENIIFKGFDFERPVAIATIFSIWFDGEEIEGVEIQNLINKLSKLKSKSLNQVKKNNLKAKKIIKELKNSLELNSKGYQKILGDNYNDFTKILNNPISPDFKTRDKDFANFVLENEKNEGLEKSIFIMGRDHMVNPNSFVPLLLKELPKQYNVSCIAIITNNGFDKLRPKFYDMNETRKIGLFSIPEQEVIPTEHKNLKVIIGSFHNLDKKTTITF